MTQQMGVGSWVVLNLPPVRVCVCSIKMPKEYINWTVPEGGGGPAYTLM